MATLGCTDPNLDKMEGNIQNWFKAFYATSDDGTAHAKYTTFFTPDAKLIMGDRTAEGQIGISCFVSSLADLLFNVLSLTAPQKFLRCESGCGQKSPVGSTRTDTIARQLAQVLTCSRGRLRIPSRPEETVQSTGLQKQTSREKGQRES